MNLERTWDADVVMSVLQSPEIREVAIEEGLEHFTPDVMGEAWLLATHDKRLVGLFNFHSLNSVTAQLHAYVMSDFRAKIEGRDSCRSALKWLTDNTAAEKVVVMIPDLFPKTKNFALKVGFVEEGFNRNSYMRDGVLHGQHLLGITRGEINEGC